MWLRALIAAQVVAVAVLASIVVARYPLWTLVDEGAHFDREIRRIARQQGFLVPAADPAYRWSRITDLRYAQHAKEVRHA